MPRRAVRRAKEPAARWRPDLVGLNLIGAALLLLAGMYLSGSGFLLAWFVTQLETGLGKVAASVPLILLLLGARALGRREAAPSPAVTGGIALLIVVACAICHLRVPAGEAFAPTAAGDGLLHPPALYGGYVGAALIWLLHSLLGQVGTPIVLLIMAVAGILLASGRTGAELLGTWMERWEATARAAKPAPKPRRAARPRAEPREPPPAAEPEPEPVATVDDWPAMPVVESVRRPRRVSSTDQLSLPGVDAATPPPPPDETRFPLPPLSLVEPPATPPVPDRTAEIEANSARLEETLASFNITARVVNTEVGPTVTRYELELAPGIRVNKVGNLTDDIAYALASSGIRIEAPVPGKGVIGIEVPNQIRETVHLFDVLGSKQFQHAPGPLPFVVGKDIAGQLKIAELTRMPHMLVAGITNSGKSVCLNCLIISLLYRLTPRELRLLMIDPKRVELSLYDGIPHLDRPVVTDPQDAADLLRGAIREMMARYDRLHELGVRNVASYNQQVDDDERMPYIVIIIDELAELMMLARAEVEASICRIAQLARATGIHLVVATQRPSVNIVTGAIKANIGTRLAFAVAQQVDSRVILDTVGAENLIGRGDMLYSPIDGGKPQRIQGAFVDEAQVNALVEYLRELPSTLEYEPLESIIQPVSADDEGGPTSGDAADLDVDELFWDCVEFARREGECSTSRLQRNFGIGYNRAGRIVDQMHAHGIVGPARGSKPRELLAGGPLRPLEHSHEPPAEA